MKKLLYLKHVKMENEDEKCKVNLPLTPSTPSTVGFYCFLFRLEIFIDVYF